MEKINITSSEIKQFEMIGQGQEGIIYRVPSSSVAIKVFNKEKFNENKRKKLELLHDSSLERMITIPEKLVSVDGEEKAYTMTYLEGYSEFSKVKELSIPDRIKYLKKVRELLEELHKRQIFVKDLRCRNILFKDDDVRFCDVDNFQVLNLEEDILNRYAREFYLYHRKDNAELDTFALNLLTLEILNNHTSDQIFDFIKYAEPEDKRKQEMTDIYQRFMYGQESYRKVILDSSNVTKYIR